MRRLHMIIVAGRCLTRQGGRRGFSVVEVTLAAFVFALVMLGAFGLLTYSIRSLRTTREIQYVTRVLETTMEAVRYLSWDELTALVPPSPAPQYITFDASYPIVTLFNKTVNAQVSRNDDYNSPLEFPDTTRNWGTVYVQTVAGQPDMRKVTVSVTYRPYAGGRRIVTKTSSTYLSRNGIDRR